MRIGQNPAKFVNNVSKPANITVAVLNYIPYQQGFYAEALEVLKACLNSVRSESKQAFDLMVFDNGSCETVQDFLLQEFRNHDIQFLVLSEKNLGKGGAWNIIFDAAPGEYIAYADSDVYFHKDWLNESLKIMQAFPNVGMVTARPFFTKKEFSTNTLNWAKSQPDVLFEQGKLIPWDTFLEFDLSLGQELSAIESEYQTNDIEKISLNGVSAIIGGSHWQFLTRKNIIKEFLPFDMERPMGQVKLLDKRMNEVGFLRLMTPEPYADNMSNKLKVNSVEKTQNKKNSKNKFVFNLLDLPIVKKILLTLHHRIFMFYYDR